jgi:hypothetical protein
VFQVRQDRFVTVGELIDERSEVGGGDPAHQDHRLNIVNSGQGPDSRLGNLAI